MNVNLFFSLSDAQNKLEQWRKNYNEIRPHSALGGMPPSEYAKALTEKAELHYLDSLHRVVDQF